MARNFYDTAAKAAQRAGDPAIAACALAYRSYIPSTKGASGRVRVLLTEALGMISETDSPATVAWIAARHAEESAQVGGRARALSSWARAEDAFGIADPDEDRVWTRFLDQNRFDSYQIATYSRAGKLEEAQEIAARVLGRVLQPDRKTRFHGDRILEIGTNSSEFLLRFAHVWHSNSSFRVRQRRLCWSRFRGCFSGGRPDLGRPRKCER
jgi:hypothetical protein